MMMRLGEDRKRIARRNLIGSIIAENIGFSVWLLWSVVATRLPKVGFNSTTDQLSSGWRSRASSVR